MDGRSEDLPAEPANASGGRAKPQTGTWAASTVRSALITRQREFAARAISRIRGAIIDELRALDWVPRSVRSRAREIERAIGQFEA